MSATPIDAVCSGPLHRNGGAGNLRLWEVIRRQPALVETFDFEGSILEPVERFFRAFGARQVPYFALFRVVTRRARLARWEAARLRGWSKAAR